MTGKIFLVKIKGTEYIEDTLESLEESVELTPKELEILKTGIELLIRGIYNYNDDGKKDKDLEALLKKLEEMS